MDPITLINHFEQFQVRLRRRNPWVIIVVSATSALAIKLFIEKISQVQWSSKITPLISNSLRRIPFIQEEYNEAAKKVADSILGHRHQTYQMIELPSEGVSKDNVIDLLQKFAKRNLYHSASGRTSGTAYTDDPTLTDIITEAYKLFSRTSTNQPELFVMLNQMEAEIISICKNLFNGNEQTCGITTSSSTMSQILACYSYREMGKKEKVTHPEIIILDSAHPSFHRAAHLLNMKCITVEDDRIKDAITKNTVMIVASCPSHVDGIIDPLEEISAVAKETNVPFHIDASFGGFLVPFFEKAGFEKLKYGFELPGVTSITVDTHKYGCAPEGTSVLLYRDKEMRNYQYFLNTQWIEEIYPIPTAEECRNGSSIAASWATMKHIGFTGYVNKIMELISKRKILENFINSIEQLDVIGEPKLSIISFTSDLSIERIGQMLKDKGWHVDIMKKAKAIRFILTEKHLKKDFPNNFITDLKKVVTEIERTDWEKYTSPWKPLSDKEALIIYLESMLKV